MLFNLKIKKAMKKIFSKKNNWSLVRLALRAAQMFIAIGIFASIASIIVPNFKSDYEDKLQAGIFKVALHVEETVSEQPITIDVCMTSDFSINEKEALRQYEKNTGMAISKDADIVFTEGCSDDIDYIYLAIK